MATNALLSPAAGRTPNPKATPSPSARRPVADSASAAAAAAAAAADTKARFEAYNRLQAAAVAFGEKLPIPEIVAIGGQSDGKSSLLEALLGFRFNVREVEMGTRRPLVLQMVHDPTALDPRCRFQEEDSEEYGQPMVQAAAIADVIKQRTESHLRMIQAAVSPKPIVMRAEYAHCPNLTIIDTPGFVLKAKKGEPERTPEEILSMVKTLASPPHRLILFLQQSSVEWCSSLWLDAIREIDPTFRRTMIVISKFDNRLKEFTERWEVDSYLSASGYLGDNIHPFFVALPKDRGTISNDEFRRQLCQVDIDVLRHLRDGVKGGFNEDKFAPYIGFSCLRKYLQSELQKRYKEAAPATLALLEQRCSDVSMDLSRLDSKLQATSDVSQLRRSAMLHAASICTHLRALLDGAADPAPEVWGKTTEEEQMHSGINSWPGTSVPVKPPNSSLKLYGGAAFERVMHEFRCATYSMECPQVSREKVANILLAHAGRGGSSGMTEAAAEIARAAARSWLAPLTETACDRLAFVLQSLFDLAMERSRTDDSRYQNVENMDGYVGFLAALRCSYYKFVKDLSKQCKQIVRHHLDSVTSPYSHICYESDFLGGVGSVANTLHRFNQFTGVASFDLSDSGSLEEGQENLPPRDQQHMTPPAKANEREVLKESQLTVPETPSPDLPADIHGGKKKDHGNMNDGGARKSVAAAAPFLRAAGQGDGELLPFAVGAAPAGCDVGQGEWVYDEAARPAYEEAACPYIPAELTCQAHGRPDKSYQHWRWQPRGCSLPSFNATVMLEMLRGKRMLFVGDSLNRAQYVSLLCLLHRAMPEGSSSFETVDALSIFRAKAYDATIEFYWAPLLAESNADDGVEHQLNDRLIRGAPMDRHSRFWKGADVLVFNSYLWWMTGDKIQILRGADNDMSKDIVEMGAEEAYRLVLHQVVRWLDGNVDPRKSRVFFVTASPTHGSGQLWGDEAEGSNCHGQTAPIADASYWGSTSRAMLRVTGEVLGASARVPVGVVNVTQMSEYRRDAHTQVYREQWAPPTKEQLADPKSYADCTHWCLPGVPDAWNELLYWKLFFPASDQAL